MVFKEAIEAIQRVISKDMLSCECYRQRIQRMQEPKGKHQQSGRWSKDEHQKFMLGIMQFGKDWKKVEQVVGSRNGSQVRSHAQKFFNKMKKSKAQPTPNYVEKEPQQPEVSDTENEFLKDIAPEQCSVNTPAELVSLIQKQSQDNKKINIHRFKKTLLQNIEPEDQNAMPQLAKLGSFKSMDNILSAYENVNEDNQKEEDQSFLIQITKRYKRFFAKGSDFRNLIDFGNSQEMDNALKGETSTRKQSFTLFEGVEGDEEALEIIKKKIKTDNPKDLEEQQGQTTPKFSERDQLNRPKSQKEVEEKNDKSNSEKELSYQDKPCSNPILKQQTCKKARIQQTVVSAESRNKLQGQPQGCEPMIYSNQLQSGTQKKSKKANQE